MAVQVFCFVLAVTCATSICSASTSDLVVRSIPDGVTFAIHPEDVNGMTGGEAPFARTYTNGTPISLNAPLTTQEGEINYDFMYWILNGTPYSTNQTVEVVLSEESTMIAKYGNIPPPDTRTLGVQSVPENQGVFVVLSPPDIDGYGSGYAPFIRTYDYATSATVTAPPVNSAGWLFKIWHLNGIAYSTNHTISVSIMTDWVLGAIYEEPPPAPVGTVIWVR